MFYTFSYADWYQTISQSTSRRLTYISYINVEINVQFFLKQTGTLIGNQYFKILIILHKIVFQHLQVRLGFLKKKKKKKRKWPIRKKLEQKTLSLFQTLMF